ncbi:MAG: hypothetical protein PHC66_00505 [Candidatus Nanoarchaeia archaeon]|nr:hypothetical protein [Candidatus Nanoarchaeia archaeon]MDD5239573.1 hypothetical protein [Candidatus Nanoarchaeia archaeon]
MKRKGLKLVEYEMWRYRYLVFFTISIIAAIFVLSSSQIRALISSAGTWGYVGAFIVGSFYTYSITSPPAAAVFFVLAQSINPFVAAALGGLGAMCGDLIIFKFIKTDILPEAKLLAHDLKIPKIKNHKLIHYINEAAPFIAGFFFAMPFLPDEMGATILGAIKYNTRKFLLISWLSNSAGLLLIALLGQLF